MIEAQGVVGNGNPEALYPYTGVLGFSVYV